MLKKYQNFIKLSKNKQCSLYQANLRQDMDKVLVKKVTSSWSWNQMLKSKALKIQSSENMFPKVLQIFKHNGSYFVVYQKPYGPSLSFFQQSIQLQLIDFYQVCNTIINFILDLKKQISDLYILPQWIFLNRNGVKICHFEPYFQAKGKSSKKQGHVFMYDVMRGNYRKDQESESSTKKKIQNLNFNLGYIAYHLLTGKITKFKDDLEDYEKLVKEIQLNAELRILKETNDHQLASLISCLLSFKNDPNDLEFDQKQNQVFEKFKKLVSRKIVELKSNKKKQNFRIVEFSLQKMKLQNSMSKIKIQKKKKCFRQCCHHKYQNEANPEDDETDRFRVVQSYTNTEEPIIMRAKYSGKQKYSSQSNKKMAENSASMQKRLKSHSINTLCFLPQVSTERKQSFLRQKLKVHQNRSTMYRKSMQMTKKYLKTQY